MKFVKIKKVTPVGFSPTADLEVDHPDHNFYCNGVVVSNSHAVAYSITSLLSVYCKFNHPKEFFLEALMMTQKKQDPYEQIALIQQEVPYFGIKLLPPDLLRSSMDFQIEGDDIRFGLSAIKGVAAKAIAKLRMFIDQEKSNKFQVFQAANETKLNVAILSALIQSGCLHSMGDKRARMVFEAQIWSKLSERERNYCLKHGARYGFDLIAALKDYLLWNDGKPFKESRLQTIRKHTQPYLEIFNKNSQYPAFASYAYEKALLGYSYSHKLRDIFLDDNPDLKTADEVKNTLDKGNFARIVGSVLEVKKAKSKKGSDYMRITLVDETGTIACIMTGEKLERYLFDNPVPTEDAILLVEGNKGDDCIFINRLATQDYKIYFNVKQLKKDDNEEEENQGGA